MASDFSIVQGRDWWSPWKSSPESFTLRFSLRGMKELALPERCRVRFERRAGLDSGEVSVARVAGYVFNLFFALEIDLLPCNRPRSIMMEVKIQCSCGTRYKFDWEPTTGLLPGAVQCPQCGGDGTAMANEIIRQRAAAPLTTVAPSNLSPPA